MKEKKKRSNREWFWRIVLALSGIGCAVLLVGMIVAGLILHKFLTTDWSRYEDDCKSEPLAFAGYARVTLPEHISNYKGMCSGFRAYAAEAQFDINPDDFDEFLATTSIEKSALSDQFPQKFHSVWQAEIWNIENLLYGIYDSMEWLEELAVDTNNPERWTVYFTVLAG